MKDIRVRSNRFVMLRGPSGSGKTTVARRLFDMAKKKTVMVQQDHYRFIFKPNGGGSKPNSEVIHQMIEHNCRCALQAGYDVILEGILSVQSYSNVLDAIIVDHAGPSYMFYFNVSLEETMRRHMTRKEYGDFTPEDMREWYSSAHRSNHELERLVPESFSVEDTLEFICKETGFASL